MLKPHSMEEDDEEEEEEEEEEVEEVEQEHREDGCCADLRNEAGGSREIKTPGRARSFI